MLLTITTMPTNKELSLFKALLKNSDQIIVTGEACYLAYTEKQLPAQGFVRQHEINKLGGSPHASWQQITESGWTDLIIASDKNVEW